MPLLLDPLPDRERERDNLDTGTHVSSHISTQFLYKLFGHLWTLLHQDRRRYSNTTSEVRVAWQRVKSDIH